MRIPAKGGADLLERIGSISIGYGQSIGEFLAFLGEFSFAFANMLRGTARFRRSDLALNLQQCGADALGIVALISFMVGAILAFMGAVQLSKFGASIYVANLVAIGMVRDMGAMMAAIIMSGRTGAAFAAQLGTMKVTQEIDALADHGHLADGVPGVAAVDCAGVDDAAAGRLCRPGRYPGRRRGGTGMLHLAFIT